MYPEGSRVAHFPYGGLGTVDHISDGVWFIRWDDNPSVLVAENLDALRPIESEPGRFYPLDIVHAAMLRHAVNAGAAITALEIIRREAKQALGPDGRSKGIIAEDALRFIEKFADDTLSQVLPA